MTVIVPVTIDEAFKNTNKGWASALRETRYIEDFTNWSDPQAYERALIRLLRAFDASEPVRFRDPPLPPSGVNLIEFASSSIHSGNGLPSEFSQPQI